jgi:hypothetical protein
MKAMKKKQRVICIIGCLCLVVGSSIASPKNKRYCISSLNQVSASLAARDYPELAKLSARAIEQCIETLDEETVAGVYANLAIAHNEMGMPQLALSDCEKCIDKFYSEPLCHREKIRALVALHREKEALSHCAIAENITSDLADKYRKKLDSGQNQLTKARLDLVSAVRMYLIRVCSQSYAK